MTFEKWLAITPVNIQESKAGDYWVSTIELFSPYHYFETMVFDAHQQAVYEARFSTLETAVDGHYEIVAALDNGTLTL